MLSVECCSNSLNSLNLKPRKFDCIDTERLNYIQSIDFLVHYVIHDIIWYIWVGNDENSSTFQYKHKYIVDFCIFVIISINYSETSRSALAFICSPWCSIFDVYMSICIIKCGYCMACIYLVRLYTDTIDKIECLQSILFLYFLLQLNAFLYNTDTIILIIHYIIMWSAVSCIENRIIAIEDKWYQITMSKSN